MKIRHPFILLTALISNIGEMPATGVLSCIV